MRFYRTSPAVYSAVRSGLDAQWGHPKAPIHPPSGTPVVTTSCMPAVEDALHDDQDRILVALPEFMTHWMTVSGALDPLLESGQVEEVAEEVYREALPEPNIP